MGKMIFGKSMAVNFGSVPPGPDMISPYWDLHLSWQTGF